MFVVKLVVAWAGALAMLLVATIAFVLVRVSSQFPGEKATGLAAIYGWLISDPLYWFVALAVVGVALWLFRRWAFAY